MKVVLFDGSCVFCNKTALYILNKSKNIQVASNQSKAGKSLIEKLNIQHNPKDTLIYIVDEKVYVRSTAALQISKSMSIIYRLLIIFIIIPKFIRDGIYNLIAKNRHRILKKEESCSLVDLSGFDDRILK